MHSLAQALETIRSPRILVVGDLILDRYTFGVADRVSSEAPIVVLRERRGLAGRKLAAALAADMQSTA